MPKEDLLGSRRVLLAAIGEVMGAAAEVARDGGDSRSLLIEANRLSLRLVEVQQEIEDDERNSHA